MKQPATYSSRRIRSVLFLIAKVGVAAGLIFYLIHIGAIDFAALSKISSGWHIGLLLALNLFSIVLNNYRWQLLLRAQGFKLGLQTTLPLTFIGLFFNFAMPGGVGGDVVKGYYLVKDHPDRKVAAGLSVFMDRMSGFFIMILMAVVALLLNFQLLQDKPEFRLLGLSLLLLLFAFASFYLLAMNEKIGKHPALHWLFATLPGGKLGKTLFTGLQSYRHHKLALLQSFAISLLSQIAMVWTHIVVGQALGLQVPLWIYFFVAPIGTVLTILPISVAGIGVGQLAFFYLYKMTMGFETQLGPTAATTGQVAQFILSLVGALLYLKKGAEQLAMQSQIAAESKSAH